MAGHGSSLNSNGALIVARFDTNTGVFSATASGLNLNQYLGIANSTGIGSFTMNTVVRITGANLDLPAVGAQIRPRFATLADKYTKGEFSYRFFETDSGLFQSLRTTATQTGSNFTFSLAGVYAPEYSTTNPVTDGIPLRLGTATFSLGSNLVAGVGNITVPGGLATNVAYFSLSTNRHEFAFRTHLIPNPGLPLAGATNLTCRLPFTIDLPVPGGTNHYETLIELKRSDANSLKWAR